ncbi:hypothetical protein B566_EDAN007754 [Ephemera danica]|nr:hypothetical protein B566_EDAN007754 [Ephemera danica]
MASKFKDLLVTVENGLRIIKLNRPKRYNALSLQMYKDIASALDDAAKDEGTKVTVLTGAGPYYCSGNDLGNFSERMEGGGDITASLKEASTNLESYVNAFITFPKLLVAVVNGPAIGIAVTTLALCDVSYASSTATFNTPFVALGQSPEACSSLLFPRIMGQSLAAEVLYMNRKLSAQEALSCGLVSRVSTDLEAEIWPMLRKVAATTNPIALGHGKRLVRGWDIEQLKRANHSECQRLEERWASADCAESVIAFLTRKSKM